MKMKDDTTGNILKQLQSSLQEWDSNKCPAVKWVLHFKIFSKYFQIWIFVLKYDKWFLFWNVLLLRSHIERLKQGGLAEGRLGAKSERGGHWCQLGDGWTDNCSCCAGTNCCHHSDRCVLSQKEVQVLSIKHILRTGKFAKNFEIPWDIPLHHLREVPQQDLMGQMKDKV